MTKIQLIASKIHHNIFLEKYSFKLSKVDKLKYHDINNEFLSRGGAVW